MRSIQESYGRTPITLEELKDLADELVEMDGNTLLSDRRRALGNPDVKSHIYGTSTISDARIILYEMTKDRANHFPLENLPEVLTRLAHSAELELDSFGALLALETLGEKRLLKEFAERSLRHLSPYDACCAFNAAKLRYGVIRCLPKMKVLTGHCLLEQMVNDILGNQIASATYAAVRSWSYGFAETVNSVKPLLDTINMAYGLADNYDCAVAVATAGLTSGFIFELFGLKMYVASCHRYGKGAKFAWKNLDSAPDLRGQRVLILDEDVVSGRTVRRVLRELVSCGAKEIDLCLNHSPQHTPTSMQNVPESIRYAFSPDHFHIRTMQKAIAEFRRRFIPRYRKEIRAAARQLKKTQGETSGNSSKG